MLVIGLGEVGSALQKVLRCKGIDINDKEKGTFDVLHIAFPYTPRFVEYVKSYINLYKPELVIIHSTVPVGTTEKCGDICVHSHVKGVHPRLEEGIRTFTKFFSGKRAQKAAQIFQKLGIRTQVFQDSRVSEAMKLWSTTYYMWNIIFEKEVHEWCEKNELNFDKVYTLLNEDYNEGYEVLGMPHVIRPILKHMEGPIGGHCCRSNLGLLSNWVSKTLLKRNKKYE